MKYLFIILGSFQIYSIDKSTISNEDDQLPLMCLQLIPINIPIFSNKLALGFQCNLNAITDLKDVFLDLKVKNIFNDCFLNITIANIYLLFFTICTSIQIKYNEIILNNFFDKKNLKFLSLIFEFKFFYFQAFFEVSANGTKLSINLFPFISFIRVNVYDKKKWVSSFINKKIQQFLLIENIKKSELIQKND